jgi:hypothetical protein
VIGIVWVQAALAAQVALRLDTEQIREGQTVRLDLQVVDATPAAVPRLDVPAALRDITVFVSQRDFRLDISSTALRRQRDPTD